MDRPQVEPSDAKGVEMTRGKHARRAARRRAVATDERIEECQDELRQLRPLRPKVQRLTDQVATLSKRNQELRDSIEQDDRVRELAELADSYRTRWRNERKVHHVLLTVIRQLVEMPQEEMARLQTAWVHGETGMDRLQTLSRRFPKISSIHAPDALETKLGKRGADVIRMHRGELTTIQGDEGPTTIAEWFGE